MKTLFKSWLSQPKEEPKPVVIPQVDPILVPKKKKKKKPEKTKKEKATLKEKPYLQVSIIMGKDNRIQTDADFNKFAIAVIDDEYQAADVDYYDPTMSDNAKVAIYLSDTMNTIAANYLPDSFKNDIKDIADEYQNELIDASQVPDMQGNFEKQVVDLGNENEVMAG